MLKEINQNMGRQFTENRREGRGQGTRGALHEEGWYSIQGLSLVFVLY